MGDKGARMQEGVEGAAEALVTDLEPLGEVSSRKMFGGFGVFCEDVMFALVDSAGTAFLKIPDGREEQYGDRHGRMPYGRIPEEVRDDPDALIALATASLTAAVSAKKK